MTNTLPESGARHVIIVGGGIVGVCCGFSLLRAGFDVTIIEKDEPGRAASYGNSGSIGLGSSPPLGMPGMLKEVPKMLLDPMHALVVRWARLPFALPWFWKFTRTLDPGRVEAIARARAALLVESGKAYDALLAEIDHRDLIYSRGLIFAYESEATLRGARAGVELRRRTGIEVQELSGDAAREVEPTLSDSIVGGIFVPNVRTTTNPLRLTTAILDAYLQRGGRLLREQVQGFERQGKTVRAVITDQGRHACDMAVISAGAWSRRLVQKLGDSVPLEAERGYHIMIDNPTVMPAVPVVSGDRNVAITSFDNGLRLTTMAEFAEIDAPPDHERALKLFKASASILRNLEIRVDSRWVGSRPSTPDSLPVIGRATDWSNVFYAFGHGHLGLTFAPVTGNLITDLALDRKPAMDILPYRPDRKYDGSHLIPHRNQ
jgi:D-amino-acid dehydrogenase